MEKVVDHTGLPGGLVACPAQYEFCAPGNRQIEHFLRPGSRNVRTGTERSDEWANSGSNFGMMRVDQTISARTERNVDTSGWDKPITAN